MRYGLIGERLAHSHSKAIHALLAPYPYELFEVKERELRSFVRGEAFGGLNVTIPYKQAVMDCCDALTDEAQQIGSVNTLVYEEDGRIIGHNTDAYGFRRMLEGAGINPADKRVLILGNGGTSRTAYAVARDMGAREIAVLSRRGENTYDSIGYYQDAEILINTTPVGMFPDMEGQLVSLTGFQRLCGVVDVVYNPLRTRLVMQAMHLGIPTVGGLPMLAYQAARAAELFTGESLEEKAEHALRALRAEVENIVLIGMPGCGKSSVGRALAALTGRLLIDTDDIIRQLSGKEIPYIFMEDGEAAFRALEKRAVQEASGQSGVLIATGGGAVLSEENRTALRQNGRVYHIQRPAERLETNGRPLSTNLNRMEVERMPLYRAARDAVVENTACVESVAREIWVDFSAQ